jgi:carbon storage regulator
MLVLTRRINESILIGDDIEIKILQVRGSGDQASIRIGIVAPKQITILRKEVYDEVVVANQEAVHGVITLPAELLEAAIQPATPTAKRAKKR